MKQVLVIGIGAGDPDQVTVQAIRAVEQADVLFEIERGTEDLTRAREALIARHVPVERRPRVVRVPEPLRDRTAIDYGGAVQAWRARRSENWERAIAEELDEGQTGGFAVWGDPSLYDSTIAVLDEILARGRVSFDYRVIPAVSSVHALTARHGISLNRVGGEVLVTTGRRLAENGWPAGIEDMVVMLDGGCSFREVLDHPLEIYWGAYLGTHEEILVSGRLAEVADEIERLRAEARERKGWIMDCYLLRKS